MESRKMNINEECRNLFKTSGITYSDITINNLLRLHNILDDNLALYRIKGGSHAKSMDIRVMDLRQKDYKFLKTKGGLQYAFIKVRGGYFSGREGISLNQDGFVGIAGWADCANIVPIANSFKEWINELVEVKNESKKTK